MLLTFLYNKIFQSDSSCLFICTSIYRYIQELYQCYYYGEKRWWFLCSPLYLIKWRADVMIVWCYCVSYCVSLAYNNSISMWAHFALNWQSISEYLVHVLNQDSIRINVMNLRTKISHNRNLILSEVIPI